MIKAFWHDSSNFGDKLTPYILSKIGIGVALCERQAKEEHYIMCGSILTACNEHSIIWGAGIAQPFDLIKPKQILAVRGKKTRDFLLSKDIDCPEIYGDPAMLLPLIYKSKTEKKRRVGSIPNIGCELNSGDFDIQSGVENVIDYICESELIVSSSLHVLITAFAYNVPFEWVRDDKVIGGDFKFKDFLDTKYNINQFIKSFPFYENITEEVR